MSFDRKQLKDIAKGMLKRNYWKMVVAALLLAVAKGELAANYSYKATDAAESISYLDTLIAMIGFLVFVAVIVFVMHPLEYGTSKFFLNNIDEGDTDCLFDGFRGEELTRCAFTMFYRNVMIGLFSLLFVIPGIIKAYEYYFVPQLMADHPELSGKDICSLSKEMTNGHKMDLFKLDMSFFLWMIANSMTLGLVGIFYYYPYRNQTVALAYRDLVMQGADPARPA